MSSAQLARAPRQFHRAQIIKLHYDTLLLYNKHYVHMQLYNYILILKLAISQNCILNIQDATERCGQSWHKVHVPKQEKISIPAFVSYSWKNTFFNKCSKCPPWDTFEPHHPLKDGRVVPDSLWRAGGTFSVVAKTLCYKPEGHGFSTRWGDFLNLPNPSSHTRPWGLLSL
jgi:hypothetical protein